MSATDSVTVTAEQHLEAQSFRRVEDLLHPWNITWVDNRKDVGRDGFVQIMGEPDEKGRSAAAPLTFVVQIKATSRTFGEEVAFRFETRHMGLWTHDLAPPVALVVYSSCDETFRWRLAKDAADELDSKTPAWREQETVTVKFRHEDALKSSPSSRGRLRRKIEDALDKAGGATTFHSSTRRTVLTEIYSPDFLTSGTYETTGPSVVVGPHWHPSELHPRDRSAKRIISAALLLYEETWVPINSLDVVLRQVGASLGTKLLRSRRIVPFLLKSDVAFVYQHSDVRSGIALFRIGDGPQSAILQRALTYQKRSQDLCNAVLDSVRVLDSIEPEKIQSETCADLRKPEIRSLIGLSPVKNDESEPVWDAPLVNRIAHMNTARTVATNQRADVVEFESGLSRIATEKWYSETEFTRLYPTSDAFDAVLRCRGVPDLGVLHQTIGMEKLINISNSDTAARFRDWFWTCAAEIVISGGDVKTEVANAFARVTGKAEMRQLPNELILAHLDVARPVARLTRPSFSHRCDDPGAVLAHQRQRHAERRARDINAKFGELAAARECVCGSEAPFEECCGA